MPEQPLIEIPVQTTGIEEAYTSIGRFAQETTNQADTLASKMQELINEGFEELATIQAQVTLKGSEDWKELQKSIAQAKTELRGVADEVRRTGAATTEEAGRITDWVTKVPSNLLSAIPGKALLGGGLLALLLYGAGETGRVAAEANQLAQVFEASSSRAIGSMEATSEMFRELAAQMGISREKIVAVVELFARMGVPADQLVHDFRNVTSNIAGASLALDAFLERPTGTTAKDFITLMARYNLEGKELISTYTGIAMAARESGIGTERFMTTVFDASRNLKTYGVDIGNITNLLAGMVSYGDRVGIPLEATLTGFQGIASGLAQMSDAWKATLGMDIMRMRGGAATPMGGIMMMETGMMRAGQPGQEQFLTEMLQALNARMDRIGVGLDEQGRKEAQYAFLTRSMRFGPSAAALLMDWRRSSQMGTEDSIAKGTEALRNALLKERLKLSPFEQTSMLMMEGISQITRGMFGLLTTLVGVVIGGLGYLVAYFAPGEKQLERDLLAALKTTGMFAGKNLEDIWSGLGQLGEAGKSLGGMLGLMGEMGTVYREAYQREMKALEARKESYISPQGPGLGAVAPIPSPEEMHRFIRAYQESREVPAPATSAETIRRLQGETGVDSIQGFLGKTGTQVSITFNTDDLIAVQKDSPTANESVG